MTCCQPTTEACVDIDDVVPIEFDYSLAVGAAVIVSATIEVETRVGTDPAPNDIKDGALTITSPLVVQFLSGFVEGVTYGVRCLATLDDQRILVGVKNIKAVKK